MSSKRGGRLADSRAVNVVGDLQTVELHLVAVRQRTLRLSVQDGGSVRHGVYHGVGVEGGGSRRPQSL